MENTSYKRGGGHTRHRRTRWAVCGLAVVVGALAVSSAAWARYYGGFGYEYTYENSYRPERLSREHRVGGEMDDWLERGNATVTLSPVFEDGIRVAAWAQGGEGPEEYEFGIASAIYHFEIPDRARQVKIRIRYEGDGRAQDLGDGYAIAGRVWLRHAGSQPGPDSDEPLQGDTFILRSDHRTETIEVGAHKYVDGTGILELHVVADGANRVDVDYIELESFSTERQTRVVRHYVPGYRFRPWQAYTYQYYYGGPFYLMTDYGYYLHWDFPYGHTTYIGLRSRHRSYLRGSYRSRYPSRQTRVHYVRRAGSRTRVNRWTGDLQTTRGQYERGRGTAAKIRRAPAEAPGTRQAVTTTLEKYRRAPTTTDRPNRALAKYRRSTASSRYGAPYAAAERSAYGTTKTRRAPRETATRLPQYRVTDTSRSSRASAGADYTKRRVYPSTNPSRSTTTRARTSATPSRSTRSTTTKSRHSTTTERKKEAPRKSSSSTKSKTTTRSKSSNTKKDDDDDKNKTKKRRR